VARGVAHPPELRAKVVATVQAGTSVTEAAHQFQLDRTLVWRWTRASIKDAPESLDELTARIAGYVRATHEAMDRQGLLPRDHHLQ
jgi:hypothetical protein